MARRRDVTPTDVTRDLWLFEGVFAEGDRCAVCRVRLTDEDGRTILGRCCRFHVRCAEQWFEDVPWSRARRCPRHERTHRPPPVAFALVEVTLQEGNFCAICEINGEPDAGTFLEIGCQGRHRFHPSCMLEVWRHAKARDRIDKYNLATIKNVACPMCRTPCDFLQLSDLARAEREEPGSKFLPTMRQRQRLQEDEQQPVVNPPQPAAAIPTPTQAAHAARQVGFQARYDTLNHGMHANIKARAVAAAGHGGLVMFTDRVVQMDGVAADMLNLRLVYRVYMPYPAGPETYTYVVSEQPLLE